MTPTKQLIEDLRLFGTLAPESQKICLERALALEFADDLAIQQLLDELLLTTLPEPNTPADALLDAALQRAEESLAARRPREESGLSDSARARLVDVYRRLDPAARARPRLLNLLAQSPGEKDLRQLAELLAAEPPTDPRRAVLPVVVLFRRDDFDADLIFPRLLDGLAHASVATAILDLANFLTRQRRAAQHPATERADSIARLLGGLVQRLARLEEHPEESEWTPAEFQHRLAETVALCVALCDAAALVGDPVAVPPLRNALDLGHRRLRVEAAAALARLGEPQGEQVLLAMVAEPVVRTRVLAYLEELGRLERVDEQHRSPVAKAEGELAAYLAEPTRFGLPPQLFELLDSREQLWPGYAEPVPCYLFRFTYDLPQGIYRGIGMAGPILYSMTVDLSDLPPEDIYAVYAGWAAEHPEIREQPAAAFGDFDRQQVARLTHRLTAQDYTAIDPQKLGYFFGQPVLVARAVREEAHGVVVADDQQIQWHPTTSRHPLTAQEAYYLYKGRRLMRAFRTE